MLLQTLPAAGPTGTFTRFLSRFFLPKRPPPEERIDFGVRAERIRDEDGRLLAAAEGPILRELLAEAYVFLREGRSATQAQADEVMEILDYMFEAPNTAEERKAYLDWATSNASWSEMPKGALAVELSAGAFTVPGVIQAVRDIWKDVSNGETSIWNALDVLGALPGLALLGMTGDSKDIIKGAKAGLERARVGKAELSAANDIPTTRELAAQRASGDLPGPEPIQPVDRQADRAATAAAERARAKMDNPVSPNADEVAPLDVREFFARNNGRHPGVDASALRYMERLGIDPAPIVRVAPGEVDQAFHDRVADMYTAARSTPNDPEVKAAYDALTKEVQDQFRVMTEEDGIKVIFTEDDPYPNSAAMMRDVIENKQLRVFSGGEPHPLLNATSTVGEHTETANNMFRAVHDYFGHTRAGNQFGPSGEENAFRSHSQMFTPLARRAMATETRGQNSWFNRSAVQDVPPRDRSFADQKSFLLPESMTQGEYAPLDELPTVTDFRVAQAHNLDGGASFTASGRTPNSRERYMVPPNQEAGMVLEGQARVSPEEMRLYRLSQEGELGKPSRFIGTWRDEAGNTHLDVSQAFTNRKLAEAVGQNANQLAYRDMKNGVDIKLPPLANAVDRANNRAFLFDNLDEVREAQTARFLDLATPQAREFYESASPRARADMVRILSYTQEPEHAAAIARLGASAADWYADSGRALGEVFGADAPRFAGFLAATSPNIGVPQNLRGALDFWKAWDDIGRPTDRAVLEQLLTTHAVPHGISLQASLNNVERIANSSVEQLLDPDMLKQGGLLSGFKVDAFYANLVGETQRYTIDTHMLAGEVAPAATTARVAGISTATVDVGRRADMTIEQVQAARWQPIKRLKELAPSGDVTGWLFDEAGDIRPERFRELREAIEVSEDFGDLLRQDDNVARLGAMGRQPPPPRPRFADLPPQTGPDETTTAALRDLAERIDATTAAKNKEGDFLFQLAPFLAAPAAAAAAGLLADQQTQDPPSLFSAGPFF